MTIDSPSSDEMIRRAKETLHLKEDEVVAKVEEDLADRGVSMADIRAAAADEPLDENMLMMQPQRSRPFERVSYPRRTTRAESPTPEPAAESPTSATTSAVPVPPSPFSSGSRTRSGRGLRIVGNALLGFVAVMWLLLLIGLIDNPDDVGETVGGGAVSTIVPLMLGLIFRRAGKRRSTTV